MKLIGSIKKMTTGSIATVAMITLFPFAVPIGSITATGATIDTMVRATAGSFNRVQL